jgi:hypothetical protein
LWKVICLAFILSNYMRAGWDMGLNRGNDLRTYCCCVALHWIHRVKCNHLRSTISLELIISLIIEIFWWRLTCELENEVWFGLLLLLLGLYGWSLQNLVLRDLLLVFSLRVWQLLTLFWMSIHHFLLRFVLLCSSYLLSLSPYLWWLPLLIFIEIFVLVIV